MLFIDLSLSSAPGGVKVPGKENKALPFQLIIHRYSIAQEQVYTYPK